MPSKIDKEPYFDRWESCVPIGSKDQPELINLPCYMHKKCNHLIKVPEDRIPPKVCPYCGSDTVKEEETERVYKRQGAVLLDAPSIPVHLKPETFT